MKIRPHRGVASFILALLIRLLGMTWRIEWTGQEHLERARALSPRIIFTFWHGRLLVLSFSHRGRNVQVLASEHYDGDLMGRIIARLGFGHLKGSTTRGGARALRQLSAVLKRGLDVGLTVDGPRGPRGVVQPGAIGLSRLSAAIIVPVSNSASRRWLLRSWDRMQLPAPFARVIIAYGEPFEVPAGTRTGELESYRIRLQERLRELTAGLDRRMGYSGERVWPHADS
ncbi:MAG: lysophospholipid acyltransferase family protein [Candidatus Krumholzibacteriota bacterium]|nr:lysophospholipid acyltransferase family protein [Candidatus Krumholzibacteriota bacterium]